MTYRVTLPLPPNLANGRLHWRAKDRKRGEYEASCAYWAIMGGDLHPQEPLERARISAVLYVHQRMDWDNLMARCKWPVDFLVKDRWIVDDSPDRLEWVGIPTQEIDRKNQRLVVTLEPVP